MPNFNAATIAESLDYDFAPHVKASGTIPEPSDDQIGEFLDAVQGVMKEAQAMVPEDLDTDNAAALLDAMNHLEAAEFVRITAKMSGVYSRLCSNHPTERQIQALPLRIRRLFFEWLQQEVINPEAVTDDGTAPAKTPLSAVVG
jgi:hypothetical protein